MKAGIVGGIKVIVKVINTHINNADICEKECAALFSMTDDNGNKIKSETAKQHMK